jgi:hypothetical protein
MFLFISFAPPKETNQRKGVRKCQLQPYATPAAHALLALRSRLKLASPSSRWLARICNPCFVARSVRTISGLPSHDYNYKLYRWRVCSGAELAFVIFRYVISVFHLLCSGLPSHG